MTYGEKLRNLKLIAQHRRAEYSTIVDKLQPAIRKGKPMSAEENELRYQKFNAFHQAITSYCDLLAQVILKKISFNAEI